MFDVDLHLWCDMCSVSSVVECDKTAQYLVSSGREIVGVTFSLGATCAVSVWMLHVMRQRDTLTVRTAKCLTSIFILGATCVVSVWMLHAIRQHSTSSGLAAKLVA